MKWEDSDGDQGHISPSVRGAYSSEWPAARLWLLHLVHSSPSYFTISLVNGALSFFSSRATMSEENLKPVVFFDISVGGRPTGRIEVSWCEYEMGLSRGAAR